ncbi:PHP domain-containing protein [candidate division WOR-3 bacterium]|nr:PHP domain-containing protein [candidate division WOR-3 bacterium]
MIGVFHIHTGYSFDATISPRRIVEHLYKLGVDFAAITDHETIKGALECKNNLKIGRLNIIIGAEYHTEKGDIIGLFLNKEVISRKSASVIYEIKKQGGIVFLPHPYRGHKLDKELIEAMDVIEVYNSRNTDIDNQKALSLAKEYNKPGIVGSDAHFLREIALTQMSFDNQDKFDESELKSAILCGKGKVIKAIHSPIYNSMLTGLIKLYKTKNPRVPVSWVKRLCHLKRCMSLKS